MLWVGDVNKQSPWESGARPHQLWLQVAALHAAGTLGAGLGSGPRGSSHIQAAPCPPSPRAQPGMPNQRCWEVVILVSPVR